MNEQTKIAFGRRALRLGHFSVDIYAAFIPTMMPIFIRQFGLSLSQAGFYLSFMPLVSSFLQPLFGVLADKKRSTRLFIIFGPIMTGFFVSLTAFITEMWQLLPLLFLASLGVAAFHPQATAYAGALAARDSEHSASIAKFILSGTIGASMSSYFAFLLLGEANILRNIIYTMPVGLIGGLVVMALVPKLEVTIRRPFRKRLWKLNAYPLALLILMVICRSMVVISLAIFIPELLYDEASQTVVYGAIGILIFQGANAIGSYFGTTPWIRNRFADDKILLFAFLAAIPAVWAFLSNESLLLLFIAGLLVNLSQAINITMAQRLIPENAATVSSLTMGFGWGIATLGMPIVGYFGDIWGLARALEINALIFLLFGALLVFALKNNKLIKRMM